MSPEQHDDLPYASPERRQDRREQRTSWRQSVTGNRRSLQLTALIMILFLLDFFWSVHTQNQSELHSSRLISAACDFWRPLTPLPVTLAPATHRPTAVSVKLIAGARESYARQCSSRGAIPPADPSLIKWAAYYHVALP